MHSGVFSWIAIDHSQLFTADRNSLPFNILQLYRPLSIDQTLLIDHKLSDRFMTGPSSFSSGD
jgi:hypothetical protein